MVTLPPDFKEFLNLLNAHGVEYLLIGGYAVAFHGYPRATADMDVWIRRTPANAARAVDAVRAFGFKDAQVSTDLFLQEGNIVRMGVAPLLIEVLTTISGVDFDGCYPSRIAATLDGVPVSVIDVASLKANKRAAGRHKDLDDLEHLP